MTSSTFSNLCVNSLTEISFIAGTYKELTFDVWDADNNAVNSASFTCEWYLAPYGNPTTVSLSKTGTFITSASNANRFMVYLYSSDTIGLGGKYIQQPVLVTTSNYEFRLGQGIINITPAIA